MHLTVLYIVVRVTFVLLVSMFICFTCKDDSFKNPKALVAHVKMFHTKELLSSNFKCAQPKCSRSFDRLISYSRHLATHEVCPEAPVKRARVDLPETSSAQSVNVCTISNQDTSCDALTESVIDTTPADFSKAVTYAALGFLGKMYAVDTLPRSHIQMIVEYVMELVNGDYLKLLERKVMNALSSNGKEDGIKEIQEMFQSMYDMFQGLENEYQRKKSFKQCGAFTEPESYIVGHALDERNLSSNVNVQPIDLTGQFISMRKTLRAFLELPGVFSEISRYVHSLENSDTTIIENFIQGRLWKDKIKPQFQGKLVLPICLYYDDFEPCDPLGSRSNVHKLGAVYYTLPCIPPEYRGSLENIFTALIFYTQDKSLGNYEVFRPVLNELLFLQNEGITVVTSDSTEHTVYFALSLFLGDNLGVHSALGLVESFTANYPCRSCKVHRNVAQTQTKCDPAILRNKLNYDRDLAVNDPSTTGIKSKCLWNSVSTFHCVENVSYDLMHDLEEGAWNYDMCFIIEELIKCKAFTLEELNHRVQGFDYGPTESANKPGLIDMKQIQKRKLHFSAAQSLCFVRYFALMVGDIVMPETKVWHFYSIIHEIVLYLTAPSFSTGDLLLISDLITQHHELYLKLFPDQTLKPKHHNMLHYVQCLMNVGPLVNLTCYRYEGNHKPFKRYAAVNCNYKNLPYSLAVKHQLKFSYRLLSQKGFNSKVIVTSGETMPLKIIRNSERFCDLLPPHHQDEVHVLKSVQISGTVYKPGMVLVVGLNDENPVFGRINVIVFNDVACKVSFVIEEYLSVSFSDHFRAYQVVFSDKWQFVNFEQLIRFSPTKLRTGPDGVSYITFRHKI